MTPENWMGLVSQYGFPMVMAFLFYFDMRKLITELDKKLDAHLINHP